MENRFTALSLKKKELEEQIDHKKGYNDNSLYNDDNYVVEELRVIMNTKIKEITRERAIIIDKAIANEKHIAILDGKLDEINEKYTNLQKTSFAEIMRVAWERRVIDTDDRVFSWRNQMAWASSNARQAWNGIRVGVSLPPVRLDFSGRHARRRARNGYRQTRWNTRRGRQRPSARRERTQDSPLASQRNRSGMYNAQEATYRVKHFQIDEDLEEDGRR
jgi:hypothetical protein